MAEVQRLLPGDAEHRLAGMVDGFATRTVILVQETDVGAVMLGLEQCELGVGHLEFAEPERPRNLHARL